MEALLFMLMVVLGIALVAAVGTYYVSHNQLVKAHRSEPEFLSLFLSLCSFAVVFVVFYFVFLDKVLMRM
jgi:phosphotransferase system  glucose/maltose/N-acetylglucosamine-specific IIC component